MISKSHNVVIGGNFDVSPVVLMNNTGMLHQNTNNSASVEMSEYEHYGIRLHSHGSGH